MFKLTQTKLILLISILFVLFYNFSFFGNVFKVYQLNRINILYVASLGIVLALVINTVLTLISSRYTTKPILILVVIISSFTAYFMDTYNVVIDDSMIRNALQTDIKESSDLFSLKLIIYFLLLGLLPSIFIYKSQIIYRDFFKELRAKVVSIAGSLILIAVIIFSSSKFYTSFFREHKSLRYYTNPTYWIYSIGYYGYKAANSGPIVIKKIGLDAKVIREPKEPHKLVVLVVGEAARADHFSLNGYKRETNPLLSKRDDIINFSNFYSCGTSTAVSVPCMFSPLTRKEYSHKKFIRLENAMDVVAHTKEVAILWVDNNSDPKGVMDRLSYIDYKNSKCNGECRDIGMLKFLPQFIEKNRNRDILIVLHQMGNHGPAYYKRYPKEFEKFTPVCKTNQLEKCTKEQINNAYDNALVYTDYFLNSTIELIKKYPEYQSAMLYISDHGESLGENGIYLHGMPYFMAPDAQKHVAAFIWVSQNFKGVNIEKLKSNRDKEYSQDNLFSTILGLLNIQTKAYNKNMDISKWLFFSIDLTPLSYILKLLHHHLQKRYRYLFQKLFPLGQIQEEESLFLFHFSLFYRYIEHH